MRSNPKPSQNLARIASMIDQAGGQAEPFAESLRRQRIPHLSFSNVTSVEFCKYRYYLQYIKQVDPSPTPDYFTKGKLLHELIARGYQHLARGEELPLGTFEQDIDRVFQEQKNNRHLRNALLVHLQNQWTGCEVLAVEQPFVIELNPELPPCVGVIDLVLKCAGEIVIVDHKTGRDFYPLDPLQMGIYFRYLRQKYPRRKVRFFYDSYRWVNNLERIRKPAFQRTPVSVPENYWPAALERMRQGNELIQEVETQNGAQKRGPCYRCPYKRNCWPK
jgi:hypothetical protein